MIKVNKRNPAYCNNITKAATDMSNTDYYTGDELLQRRVTELEARLVEAEASIKALAGILGNAQQSLVEFAEDYELSANSLDKRLAVIENIHGFSCE